MVEGIDGLNRTKLKADAEVLLRHLKSGGKLRIGPWRPKPAKDARYITESIYVNGRLCNSVETLQDLLLWVDVIDQLEALDTLWQDHITPPKTTSLPIRLAKHRENLACLKSCLDLSKSVESAQGIIDLIAGLSQPRWSDMTAISSLEKTAESIVYEDDLRLAQSAFDDIENLIEDLLIDPDHHPVIPRLAVAIRERDVESYATAYNDLVKWVDAKRLLDVLSKSAHPLAESLATYAEDSVWENRMSQFQAAWNWARADNWLRRLSDQEEQQRILRALDARRQEIQTCLAKLAAEKAWRYCMKRLTQHHSQHLRAWQQAVKSIGKGTGKHANKHRKDARHHLEECRSAIPAWIMPIYRVAETIEMKPDIFDVVIVDEASQSGPEALFLQYLAKKIIVVGDDKQISPQFIGINKDQVDSLRDQFIKDLPHGDRLGIEHSLFDQAFIRYPSHICLREHFRCMPEIIQFSNNLCYSSAPLIPLKQYGGGRLTPTVVTRYIEAGYQEGRSPRVTNPAEAEAIVDEIERCLEKPEYKAKTIGVISLLGEDQARLIQSMLVERMGADAMERHQIHCGDAYAFQGDERDVMFLSMVSAPGDHHRITALADAAAERRFNVAASRAKEQTWLFHSVTLNDLSQRCVRRKLLEYCLNPRLEQTDVCGINIDKLRAAAATVGRHPGEQPPPFDSWFEVDVFLRIKDKGYRVIPQCRVGVYTIDLIVEGMRGRLAVECDGDEWHGPEKYEEDLARQRQLERSGYTFWRVRGSAFYRDPDKAMECLWNTLQEMDIRPTAEESVAASGVAPVDPSSQVNVSSQPVGITAEPNIPSQVTSKPEQAVSTSPSRGGNTRAARYEDGLLREYFEWTPRKVPDPRAAAPELVIKALVEIVETEGPMTWRRVFDLYRRGLGFGRLCGSTRKALKRVAEQADGSGRIEVWSEHGSRGFDDWVVHIPESERVIVRERGPCELEDVPCSEIAELMRRANLLGLPRERAFRKVLELYGLKRLTRRAEEHLEHAHLYCRNGIEQSFEDHKRSV